MDLPEFSSREGARHQLVSDSISDPQLLVFLSHGVIDAHVQKQFLESPAAMLWFYESGFELCDIGIDSLELSDADHLVASEQAEELPFVLVSQQGPPDIDGPGLLDLQLKLVAMVLHQRHECRAARQGMQP
jgi:hypothetical protein